MRVKETAGVQAPLESLEHCTRSVAMSVTVPVLSPEGPFFSCPPPSSTPCLESLSF